MLCGRMAFWTFKSSSDGFGPRRSHRLGAWQLEKEFAKLNFPLTWAKQRLKEVLKEEKDGFIDHIP